MVREPTDNLGFRVQGLGCRPETLNPKTERLGFRVQDIQLKAQVVKSTLSGVGWAGGSRLHTLSPPYGLYLRV